MPARDLFHGDNFQRARDRALGMGLPWFVLSAKFGLLHPYDVVGPFDVYLGKQPAACRARGGGSGPQRPDHEVSRVTGQRIPGARASR
jgi:hypothetical protein